jgi:hypothetical protein
VVSNDCEGAALDNSSQHLQGPDRGDFYVESVCCMSCGVPQAVAPDLVGWTDGGMRQCYWKKQPETSQELMQAIAIFDGQEAGCHRYAGTDPEIQLRVGIENCDRTAPRLARLNVSAAGFPHSEGLAKRVWTSILAVFR